MTTLWFDDLETGRTWRSPSRTITESDVGAFAGLTGDRFPLHTSEIYAAGTRFGTRIAHGLLGLSFAHGLMWCRTGELDESMIAFLGIGEWRFLEPIHFGDSILVEYEAAGRRLSESAGDRGIVDFDVRVLNHNDTLIQHGRKTVLIARETT